MNKRLSKAIIITCTAAAVAFCGFALSVDKLTVTGHVTTLIASPTGATPAASRRLGSDTSSDIANTVDVKSKVSEADASATTPPKISPPHRGLMAQLPGNSVRVAVTEGLLSIRAVDAPLQDVLDAVHRATGALVEIEGYSGERVSVNVRSIPITNALKALLDQSQYDYILMSSIEEPIRIERIVLSHRHAVANRITTVPPRDVGAPVAVTTPERGA